MNDSTQRLYEPGDWVKYRFCGGISYARLNSYKWYVPRPWTDQNDVTHYADSKIIYNATKLYGINSGYPYMSSKWERDGWEPLSGYNLESIQANPDCKPKDWPDGMQPKMLRVPHTFLPVWQEDIIEKVDFDSPKIPHPRWDNYNISNIMYWFDKNKLEDMACPEKSNDPTAHKHEWFINRFEERKREVLTRKLEQ